ncbi:hypothetical protein [Xanthomonas phage Xp15]|uniref:Uncharacterized protein n=1 Tax=Xanthomonas phage Xp15 TaxID=322855 RepID=Q52PP2_9CAUD|nr:hypothetical protein XPXV15_gp34 [Xanthomonas phage Xp15]AAX84873.1 hypothetical protein [Xanthomonas phage Xp15]
MKRFLLQNLGALGEAGKSLFSTHGTDYATQLIEEGWVPCGMCINQHNEVIQTFYKPLTEEVES